MFLRLCAGLCDVVQKCAIMCENVRTCTNMFVNVRACAKMLGWSKTLLLEFPNRKCILSAEIVLTFPNLKRDVFSSLEFTIEHRFCSAEIVLTFPIDNAC